ncbi:MAG: hypothetical protein ICV68_16270 [Pyrinomonadaceae bacterium]|nr:hypothetical protein [Pyrinomonadaceae bacterium]
MRIGILAALVVCVAASAPVMAGEIKGNGQYIQKREEVGRSACKYSGLNDAYYDEYSPEYPEASRTQSFGQLVRQGLKSFLPSPGDACNPN